FQDYKKYGKYYIKRLMANSGKLTRETGELIFSRLPRIYKYKVISIIGDLDDETFRNARHFQLYAPEVRWISPVKAELMHVIKLLDDRFKGGNIVDVMIKRSDEVEDYYSIINKKS